MDAMPVQDEEQDLVESGPVSPFGVPVSQAEAARRAVDVMVEARLDKVMAQVDAGEFRLTGDGGFRPEMLKRALVAVLRAELTDHLAMRRATRPGRDRA